MITLYTIPALWGLPSISPPSMKLETWFRLANLPYTIINELNKLDESPKGTFPFIDYNGKLISDSTLIIDMFQREKGINLDKDLSANERAVSLAFRRMLQEHSYWGVAYIRYVDDENWNLSKEVLTNLLFAELPQESREPMLEDIRSRYFGKLNAVGITRHTSQEVAQIFSDEFQALSDLLADRSFFFGEHPTTLDATAYAYIGNIIKPPFNSPIVDYVRDLDNLCQHYERMSKKFFNNPESSLTDKSLNQKLQT